MNQAQKIHKQLLALPYFRNYQAVSGSVHNLSSHEDAVEDVLLNNSLVQSNFKELASSLGFSSVITCRDVLLHGEHVDSIPNNVYFSQPTGTHNSPDFIFKVNNKVFFVECKSGNKNAPMYNGGLPKIGYIYLFCSKKSNETTMYLGDDIVNTKQRKIIDEFEKESEKLVVELNKKLRSLDTQNRGLSYYQRHMWSQSGGAKYTDYFKHENKTLCEEKVETLFND
jgi:hypothetical protein|tara:strand:+ start:225 stop:899 length:675 start_codon:yes stop_codon:yes gene_type:complete